MSVTIDSIANYYMNGEEFDAVAPNSSGPATQVHVARDSFHTFPLYMIPGGQSSVVHVHQSAGAGTGTGSASEEKKSAKGSGATTSHTLGLVCMAVTFGSIFFVGNSVARYLRSRRYMSSLALSAYPRGDPRVTDLSASFRARGVLERVSPFHTNRTWSMINLIGIGLGAGLLAASQFGVGSLLLPGSLCLAGACLSGGLRCGIWRATEPEVRRDLDAFLKATDSNKASASDPASDNCHRD